jgi:ABC-type multidrug transport system ATPase subunit
MTDTDPTPRTDRDATDGGGTRTDGEEHVDEAVDGAPPAPDDGATRGDGRAVETDAEGPAVATADLHHGFGDVTVLDGVSLDVDAGSLAALVGPNGSGKSTLLRIVAGVLAPDGGRVDVAAGGIRPVGYLPQQPSFRPGFSVADTLGFYAGLLGPDAAAAVDVEGVLERVGLARVGDRRVEALSGGMTRLLGVAQALLGDPPVLVLDEPASGLDPAMSAHVYGTVRDVADEGRTVLLASHDLVSVERTADRVALLDRGRIVHDGDPGVLVDDADADDLTEVFLDAVAGAATADERASGAPPTVRADLDSTDGGGHR